MEEKIHHLDLRIKTNELQIDNIVNRMDSYHHDSKQRFDKIDIELDKLPTSEQTKLMFVEETRKLIDGMGAKIVKLETNQKWIVGIGGTVGAVLARIAEGIFK